MWHRTAGIWWCKAAGDLRPSLYQEVRVFFVFLFTCEHQPAQQWSNSRFPSYQASAKFPGSVIALPGFSSMHISCFPTEQVPHSAKGQRFKDISSFLQRALAVLNKIQVQLPQDLTLDNYHLDDCEPTQTFPKVQFISTRSSATAGSPHFRVWTWEPRGFLTCMRRPCSVCRVLRSCPRLPWPLRNAS